MADDFNYKQQVLQNFTAALQRIDPTALRLTTLKMQRARGLEVFFAALANTNARSTLRHLELAEYWSPMTANEEAYENPLDRRLQEFSQMNRFLMEGHRDIIARAFSLFVHVHEAPTS